MNNIMKCDNCQYRYEVADNIYYNKDSKITCPQCGSRYKTQLINFADRYDYEIKDEFSISSTSIKTSRETLDESTKIQQIEQKLNSW